MQVVRITGTDRKAGGNEIAVEAIEVAHVGVAIFKASGPRSRR
ncbi:MAG: hypothetical protein V4857_22745 [Pseudomonadota bacterium]